MDHDSWRRENEAGERDFLRSSLVNICQFEAKRSGLRSSCCSLQCSDDVGKDAVDGD